MPGEDPKGYEPRAYWSQRLTGRSTLRATGNWSYGEPYNVWLYRAKRRALRWALSGVPRQGAILDVGVGTGWGLGELLQWRAPEQALEGCDIADVAVDQLRAEFPDVELFRAGVGSDPVPRPDGYYSLVTLVEVAFHITDDGVWRRAVEEIGRVLTPRGHLIAFDSFGRDAIDAAEHVRFRSRGSWEEAAAAAGLRLVAARPCFRWLSRPPEDSRLRAVPQRLRGVIEYGLELVAPTHPPHMQVALFEKR